MMSGREILELIPNRKRENKKTEHEANIAAAARAATFQKTCFRLGMIDEKQ